MAVRGIGVGSAVEGAAGGGALLVSTGPAARHEHQNCREHQQHQHQSGNGYAQREATLRDAETVRVVGRLQERQRFCDVNCI